MRFFAQSVYQGARDHSMTVATENAQTPEEISSAFDRLIAQQVQAVLVPGNGLFISQRARIVQIALAAHCQPSFLKTWMSRREDLQAMGSTSAKISAELPFIRIRF